MADLYEKLKTANTQLDKAQEVFEDVGDAMMERGMIDEPIKATAFAETIRNAKIGGSTDYNELENKPTIGETPIQGDIEPLLDASYAKLTDIPTKVSDLENDAGYISKEGAVLTGDVTLAFEQEGFYNGINAYRVEMADNAGNETSYTAAGIVVDAGRTANTLEFPQLTSSQTIATQDWTNEQLEHFDKYEAGEGIIIDDSAITSQKVIKADFQAIAPLTALNEITSQITSITSDYATKSWVGEQGYINYAELTGTVYTKEEADASIQKSQYQIKQKEPYIDDSDGSDRLHVDAENFTVNVIDLPTDTLPLDIYIPQKPQGDVVRDFVVRVNIVGPSVPVVTFVAPLDEEVSFESDDENWRDLAIGANIISFSETQRG